MKRERQQYYRAERSGRTWLRLLRRFSVALFIALVGMELFARYVVGLGDPVLYRADDQMRYIQLPCTTYHRYGNIIRCNAYSMRSDDFPIAKNDPDELRVMVIGDSIVYGGTRIDQSELATEVLKRELTTRVQRPVVVGNIAAGGWSPENELAYARHFGLFNADVVVVVLNSSDLIDNVSHSKQLGFTTPQHKPILALQEAVERGVPWLLAHIRSEPQPTGKELEAISREHLSALCELLDLAKSSGARVIVVQHAARNEVGAEMNREHVQLAQAVQMCGVESVFTGPAYDRADDEHGASLFQDVLHLNSHGQRVLGEVLVDAVMHVQDGEPRFVDRGPARLAALPLP